MKNYSKLLVIPNEEEVLQGVFDRKVNSNRNCTNALIDFRESNNYFI